MEPNLYQSCRIVKNLDDTHSIHVVTIDRIDVWAQWSSLLLGDPSATWVHESVAPKKPCPSVLISKPVFPLITSDDWTNVPLDSIGFCAIGSNDGNIFHIKKTQEGLWTCNQITDLDASQDSDGSPLHFTFYTWGESLRLLVSAGAQWLEYVWKPSKEPLKQVIQFAVTSDDALSHVTCKGSLKSIFYNDELRVYFRGTNGLIYECTKSGPEWKLIDLSSVISQGNSVTKIRPTSTDLTPIVEQGVIHVFFIGLDQRLRELYKVAGRSWRHVSLRRHVGGPVCDLPNQAAPLVCATNGSLHVFFRNSENRLGEIWWKPGRNKWRAYDVSDYIPSHGKLKVLLDCDAATTPHLFFECKSLDGTGLSLFHLYYESKRWQLTHWGSTTPMEDDEDDAAISKAAMKAQLAANKASSSTSFSIPAPPPPPTLKPTAPRITITKKPLIVKLPLKPLPKGKSLEKATRVRMVLISDTHNYAEHVGTLPEGDILVHTGDFTVYGTTKECTAFAKWLDTQTQFKHKVVIAGNHEVARAKAKASLKDHCWWLDDKTVNVMGLNFYGTTWGCNYAELPTDGIDILLTHKPPVGHGDIIYTGESRGSKSLLESVNKMKPILHVFGHNHEGFGATCNSHTVFINAATCLGSAKSTNRRSSIVVDIYPEFKEHYGNLQDLSDVELESSGISRE